VRPVDPRLLRQGRAARGYLAVTVGLGLAGTVLILLQAGLLAAALAGAARGIGIGALAGTLAWLGVVLAGRAAAAAGSEAAALRAAAEVKSGLRRRLSAHALRLGPAWLGGQQAGEITALATKGLDGLDAYFARYLPQLMLAVIVPLAVLIRIALADWISAVIIAVTLPLIPLFGILIGWHTRAQTQRQWRLLALLGGHFLDVVAGLPTLKLFGRARAQAEVIEEVTSAHRKATMTTLRVAFLSALALELTAALATALVAVEIGLRLLYGHVSYQTALLVLLLTPEAYLPLRNAGGQFHASTEGVTAAQRAFEILDTPLPAPRGVPRGLWGSSPRGQPSRGVPGGSSPRGQHSRTTPAATSTDVDLSRDDIALRTVTLSYPGRGSPALDEISLNIAPGERIVLTGPNGAGKSSLLSLLLRFAAPTGGTITAGGVDLAQIPADCWRSQLAWVPQRPHLFTATIAENIALGQPGARREEIAAAACLAGADDFIRRLHHGYDTVLAEGGRSLSAGQRQKLALARAFLRRAPVLLLDEPTAHLDPSSADRITAALEDQMADRTVILVTHRMPPRAGWATRALALDHGQLTDADDPVRRAGLVVTP
jgi:ATP-binding cassette, subfamily C, bacterial CydD